MSERILVMFVLTVLVAGCETVVEHNDVQSVVSEPAADVVARVNDRTIGADELRREMERTESSRDDALEALIDREILVAAALEAGEGEEVVPVKSAMVRAYLEDKFEKKITLEQVTEDQIKAHEEAARLEMLRPEGYEVAAMSIYVPTTVEGEAPSLENLEAWTELASQEATRVRDWLLEDPTPARVRSFDASTLPEPLRVSTRPEITVANAAEVAQTRLPEGWTPNTPLADAASKLDDGGAAVVKVGQAFFVFARLAKIERTIPNAEQVRAAAEERSLTELRRQKLEEHLEELRASHDVDLYPEVIAEAAQGTETTSP